MKQGVLSPSQSRKQELLDRLAGQAEDRGNGAVPRESGLSLAAYLRHYYSHASPADLLERPEPALIEAAIEHLDLGAHREPETPKIRAFNPSAEGHGWESRHSVVQVVNDDMPFLVDSITAEVNRHGLSVHLVVHPVLHVERDATGRILHLGEPTAASRPESWISLEVTESPEDTTLTALETDLADVLADVRAAVHDWQPMRRRSIEVADALQEQPWEVPADEVDEVEAFLRWVEADHFTYIGYRQYRYQGEGDTRRMTVVPDSGLGILSDPEVHVFEGMREIADLPEAVQAVVEAPEPLLMMKATRPSTVHRPQPLDSIGIKIIDASGAVVGEHRFLGLFTSAAYSQPPIEIPVLRRKVRRVLERSSLDPKSHDGKALMHILDNFPRDELFQIAEDELFHIALGILHLQERQRIALFVRRDNFERFVSCLVYVPRDRFSTQLREHIQAELAASFNGDVTSFNTWIGDSVLARLHVVIATTPGEIPDVNVRAVEAQLVEVARSWQDDLREVLVTRHGEAQGLAIHQQYVGAFPTAYRERFEVSEAVSEIERIEAVAESGGVMVHLYSAHGEGPLRVKLLQRDRRLAISAVLPSLENLGLWVVSQHPFAVSAPGSSRTVWVHDLEVHPRIPGRVDVMAVRPSFEDAFRQVWTGQVEDDALNRLVLAAGLDAREIDILRAYARYLNQIGFPLSQASIADALVENPGVATAIVGLFQARLEPGVEDRERRIEERRLDGERGLDQVTSADEDRVLRRLTNLVGSTLRTNAYQTTPDGRRKPYLALKLKSTDIQDLPLPRPMVEIFVFSPETEGIHLRGGRVARGGIRWSDRREDFRSEILGLMKAQMVKNAVIVPVGSKGGFVVKQPPASGDRDAMLEAGVRSYRTLIRGLLDVTDNLVDGEVVPPPDVVRHDGDDPYLVVAADKGTATFSDLANAVSREYGFWLDDAFASGGSAGYDHKAMGITARGAWESVKRHFREMGVDTQTTDFTVAGVGDMSGDVFGNGMLLSEHIRLVAAFNHLHIFVDPHPDATVGFAERRRLFELPRSTWDDYDRETISAGGGVWSRSAKAIPLSPEMRELLGLEGEFAKPEQIIRQILTLDVDLLWFGGIGTYVKASRESHADVLDRINDPLRVEGRQLRAKVVGEGANLGMTQLGRVEYAMAGGRLNTDAIDNSAGVDTSDHEVNLKILLGQPMQAGTLSREERDALLEGITGEVAASVLRDNYLQTLAISVAESRAPELLDRHAALIRDLERSGRLDRNLEGLPDEESVESRRETGRGLTRPEIAVLLAYAKNGLYAAVLESNLPDAPALVTDLERYFPDPVVTAQGRWIPEHPLRREIVATRVTNSLVNRMGPAFMSAVSERTGHSVANITRAYVIARAIFEFIPLWQRIEELDYVVDASVQHAMLWETISLAQKATDWCLSRNDEDLDIGAAVAEYREGVALLRAHLVAVLGPAEQQAMAERQAHWESEGVPAAVAAEVAALPTLFNACALVGLARDRNVSVVDVARTYYALGERLSLDRVRAGAAGFSPPDRWSRRAADAVLAAVDEEQLRLTAAALTSPETLTPDAALDRWMHAGGEVFHRVEAVLGELGALTNPDLSALVVAVDQLRELD